MGNDSLENALPLTYIDNDFWAVTVEVKNPQYINQEIKYNYILKTADGNINYDWGSDKSINPSTLTSAHTIIIDSWNYAGYYENGAESVFGNCGC